MIEPFLRATSFPSLLWATAQAAQGKRQQPEVARFVMDAERECLALQHALRLPFDDPQAWQLGPCQRFVLHDPKRRVISVVPFRDRVVHHALCRELLPALERYAIFDSYACRCGKGQHAALFRLQQFSRHPSATWAFKGDIAGYFASIPHDRLMNTLRRRVRDESLCQWVQRIVRAYPAAPGHGLPIGALTSQHLANLYLGELDHYIKDTLGVRFYLRYMDDFVALGSRQEMDALRTAVSHFLREHLQLALNPQTTRMVPVCDGVPFLGMRVYKALIRIRRGRWQRFVRRQAAIEAALSEGQIAEEEAAARLSSQYAHLQQFNTQRLRCEHLARCRQAGLGKDHRRLESGEPGRLLGQRRAEGARRQPRQERAGQPQPEPGLSSFELSASARPSGLVRGKVFWPEAGSLRTAAPVPRC